MKILEKARDGGPESTVWGYFLVEIKCLFSIVLLKFEGKSRPAYHSHAFNAISWVLNGMLTEYFLNLEPEQGKPYHTNAYHLPGLWPVLTFRDTFHKVDAEDPTWVLSFRGPWSKTWKEYTNEAGEITLAEGRVRVDNDA